MKRFHLLLGHALLSAVLLVSAPAQASDWWVPDQGVVQGFGYQGAIAAGVNYGIQNWYELEFLYGYSPEFISGHAVHQLTMKNRFIYQNDWLYQNLSSRIYLGLGLINGLHSGLFYRLPERYPRSYYAPTALRTSLHLGWDSQVTDKWSAFAELVYLDSEWSAALIHSDGMRWREFGSFAVGLRWKLD